MAGVHRAILKRHSEELLPFKEGLLMVGSTVVKYPLQPKRLYFPREVACKTQEDKGLYGTDDSETESPSTTPKVTDNVRHVIASGPYGDIPILIGPEKTTLQQYLTTYFV